MNLIFFIFAQINQEHVTRLNLADCRFSFESNIEFDQPAWLAPEGKV